MIKRLERKREKKKRTEKKIIEAHHCSNLRFEENEHRKKVKTIQS